MGSNLRNIKTFLPILGMYNFSSKSTRSGKHDKLGDIEKIIKRSIENKMKIEQMHRSKEYRKPIEIV